MFFFLFLAKVNVRFIKSLSTFYRPNSPIFARAWSRDEREKMNIEIVLNFLTPVSAHYHTTERRYYEKKSITTSQQQQKNRKTRVKREEKKVPTEEAEKLDVESCWAGQVRSVALVPHCNFLVHIKQKLDEDVKVALTTQQHNRVLFVERENFVKKTRRAPPAVSGCSWMHDRRYAHTREALQLQLCADYTITTSTSRAAAGVSSSAICNLENLKLDRECGGSMSSIFSLSPPRRLRRYEKCVCKFCALHIFFFIYCFNLGFFRNWNFYYEAHSFIDALSLYRTSSHSTPHVCKLNFWVNEHQQVSNIPTHMWAREREVGATHWSFFFILFFFCFSSLISSSTLDTLHEAHRGQSVDQVSDDDDRFSQTGSVAVESSPYRNVKLDRTVEVEVLLQSDSEVSIDLCLISWCE